jgi:PAS domain S-box-containing protein
MRETCPTKAMNAFPGSADSRPLEAPPLSRTGYFEWLFETAPDGILILHAETGAILDANPFMLSLLGYTADELLEKRLWEISPARDAEQTRQTFVRLQKVDRSRYTDLSLEAKDGRLVEVEFVGNAYCVDASFIIQCNIRDVTEHRRLERLAREQVAELERSNAEKAELERSNAELEQFSYVASHDLQEPLRAVAGCVQLLQKRYRGRLDESADELIAHALEGTRRMETLIRDLLAFSRVGTQARPPERVDCRELLGRVLEDLTVSISESGAVITIDPLPTVMADPLQLAQLFQNLVGNAIKFRAGDRPPAIRVSAMRGAGGWTFSVADNGIGIEERQFERIFRVFQRLHTRKHYQGTGIGLAICKKIVEQHGGRLWVESRIGEGSAFHFSLPGRT